MQNWSATRVRITGIAVCALLFAYAAWARRWMSDDGLIFTRTVRQILEGNGPVFNEFERAESGTSTLWTYLLVVFGAPAGNKLAHVQVYLGLLLSVGSVIIGMAASARLYRDRDSMMLPGAVIVVLGMYPFWDFATSGLETGLGFAWLALCYWLLVTLRPERLLVSAITFGLGPLVRPDFGIVSIVMFVAAWLLARPNWKQTLALGAAGIALPFAYEIFRAGYYGTLVPLPALAKSATTAEWARGFAYLRDFNHPYLLWIPLVVLLGLLAYAARRYRVDSRERILVAAPLIAAALMTIYVLRVGGDFMHARMFLPALFVMLLPGFMFPLARFTAPVTAVLAIWAIVTVVRVADGWSHATGQWVEDERAGYVGWTRRKNPIDPKVFVIADRPASGHARAAIKYGNHVVLSQDTMYYFPMHPSYKSPIGMVAGRLGTGGAEVPLDTIVIDTLGLANPLGARITPTNKGFPGHEKPLPYPWIVADFGAPDAVVRGVPPVLVRAARRAMQCGELKELLESAREPMTLSRFWKNLTGSVRRTRLEIPADPVMAEQKFCGSHSETPIVTTSSTYEDEGWSAFGAVDGVRESTPETRGYSSKASPIPRTQWFALQYSTPRKISRVTLYPAADAFPLDVTIQIWDGKQWVDRVTKTGFSPRPGAPQALEWNTPDLTTGVRVVGTRLMLANDGFFYMVLAEIEPGE